MTLFEKCIVTSQGVLLTVLGAFGLLHIKQNKKINTLEQDKTKMQTQITDLEQRCVQLKTKEEQLIFSVLLHGMHVVRHISLNQDNSNTVTINRMTPKYYLSHFRITTQNVDRDLKDERPLKDGYKYDCTVTSEVMIPIIALARLRLYGELPCEYDYNKNLGWTKTKLYGWHVVIKDANDNILPDDQVQDAFATPSMPKPTSE